LAEAGQLLVVPAVVTVVVVVVTVVIVAVLVCGGVAAAAASAVAAVGVAFGVLLVCWCCYWCCCFRGLAFSSSVLHCTVALLFTVEVRHQTYTNVCQCLLLCEPCSKLVKASQPMCLLVCIQYFAL
jgi:uncharacterized membrane protein